MQVSTGLPFPLGPSASAGGINFAVFASQAHALDLCLFDPQEPAREIRRVRFPKCTAGVWHVRIDDLAAGVPYALRAYGRWDPAAGLRYNPRKLLLDPYAPALTGPVAGHPLLAGAAADGGPDPRDSAGVVPRCLVPDEPFDWGDDAPPRTRLDRTVIYETHVRGLTMRHPDVPEPLRGTFAGLASEPVLEHLRRLGVTAVQLLPVQQHIDDPFLLEKGLTNYWGYQPVGYFAPQWDYAADRSPGGSTREFKAMVKALHRAGLEVILDVVFNHTGEGGPDGPVVSFRGLDNEAYYRATPGARGRYLDFTGTGNTLDLRQPMVLKLVLDSLRYWATEMHVDGFRFDLAATLGRESDDFDPNGGFFRAVRQDPVLATVKLIAEPWDTGWGGYQLGAFPAPFSELNGRFRDDVRAFWRGDPGSMPALASRLTGSEDRFGEARRPQHGVNFITCHDGFTLRDLVSYNDKHNLANGEDNRDGDSHNLSWNCGIEGPSSDPQVLALRARQQRNLLATLFLSQGIPFLLGGDELQRSQGGNNNAYCQDNEVSWFDWSGEPPAEALQDFIRGLVDLRRANPVFRKRRFLHGNFLRGSTSRDVIWLTPEGRAMADQDWQHPERLALGMLLSGSARSTMSDWRRSRHGSSFLMLLNAEALERPFLLPGTPQVAWQPVLDTRLDHPFAAGEQPAHHGHSPRLVASRSLALLRLEQGSEWEAQLVATA
jgi:isoamylase